MTTFTVNPGNPGNGGSRRMCWCFDLRSSVVPDTILTSPTGYSVTLNNNFYIVYIGPTNKPTQLISYHHHLGMLYSPLKNITSRQANIILHKLNIPANQLTYVMTSYKTKYLECAWNITNEISTPFTPVFSCNLCEYQTENKRNLFLHNQTKHLNVTYPCSKCSYKATQKVHLKRHDNTHHSKKTTSKEPYVINICISST